MLNITLLGTAATMPLSDRALSSAALECRGRIILFDCGEGTQVSMRKVHVNPMKIDLIALTHYHGDHIFGLPGLLQTMNCYNRTEPLYITGPAGLENAMAPILTLAGDLNYRIELISSGTIFPHDLNHSWPITASIKPFETNHRTASQGYSFVLSRPGRFDPQKAKALHIPLKYWGQVQNSAVPELELDGTTYSVRDVIGLPRRGLKFVFSGDTAPCPALTENASEADLMICDATYGEDSQAELAEQFGHCTFSQAGQIAGESGCRRLWLSHFSQRMENPKEYLSNAKQYFEEAECGTDGMKIKLSFNE